MKTISYLAACFIALGVASILSAAPAADTLPQLSPNLVPDGEFESVAPADNKLPAGWTSMYPKGVEPKIVAEARPDSKGKQCLYIPTNEANNYGGVRSPLFSIDPQTKITISGWVKTGGEAPGPGAYFGIAYFDAKKNPVIMSPYGGNYTYVNSATKTDKWTFVQTIYYPCNEGFGSSYKQFQSPPTAAYGQIMLFSNAFPKPVWFDDISVIQELNPADQIAGPPSPDWIIGWQGPDAPQAAYAREVAKYLSRVKGVNIATGPWAKSTAKTAIVFTDAASAPPELAARLKDAHRDAFLIEYPINFQGREVCLIVSKETKNGDLAAYYFLNKYAGVDWVGPGVMGEVAPSQPDWKLPSKIDDVQNPSYEHRYWQSVDMNTRRWGAGSFRMQFHHNLWNVFDPVKYKDQPDIYPFYEGARHVPDPTRNSTRTSGWQPSTGNPKVVDMAVAYGLDFLKKNPNDLSFSLTVNDGGTGFCMCPLCLAQDAKNAFDVGNINMTDRFFRFYNEVIGRVLEKDPNAYLAVQAYGRTKVPPSELKAINPRIQVFDVCDNTSPNPDVSERQKLWKAAGASPSIYQWLWDGGFLTVRSYPHASADLIKLSNDLGGLGFYGEQISIWAACGPKYYVISHTLWDTKSDTDVLLDRYMKAAFGSAAAPAMRAYFDQWEKIWERPGKAMRYNTGRGWENSDQLKDLTRDDLLAMDAGLDKALAADATPVEKMRINLVADYYKWLRVNADQYVVTLELSDPAWVAKQSPEKVLSEAVRGRGLTPQFEALWDSTISQDKTGWLIPCEYQNAPKQFWKENVAGIRAGVIAAYDPAIDVACDTITQDMLKKSDKAKTVAFWKQQLAHYPDLGRWIDTQIYLLSHGPGPNIAVNGDFAKGTPGASPAMHYDYQEACNVVEPQVPNWGLSGNWEGVKTVFAWETNTGHNNGHALAIGWGYNGSISNSVATKAGHRYRATVWYKTSFVDNRTVKGTAANSSFNLKPTDGQWRQATTTFTAAGGSTRIVLEANGQDRGQWTWYDDLQVVQIDD